MNHIDWALTGQATTIIIACTLLVLWVGSLIAVAAVQWDRLAHEDAKDERDEVRELARTECSMADMDDDPEFI